MKRSLVVAALALAGLLGVPARASADLTFFFGFTPTPTVQSVRGVSAGVNLLILGFEFEYALSREDTTNPAPGLQTGMFNVLVMTPTSVSLYATAGAGVFRETLGPSHITNVGTNIGGGVKFPLLGPLKVRVDYRVLALRGGPQVSRPQRLYVGVNWAF
jgi:opacity protein-like surface antigen